MGIAVGRISAIPSIKPSGYTLHEGNWTSLSESTMMDKRREMLARGSALANKELLRRVSSKVFPGGRLRRSANVAARFQIEKGDMVQINCFGLGRESGRSLRTKCFQASRGRGHYQRRKQCINLAALNVIQYITGA